MPQRRSDLLLFADAELNVTSDLYLNKCVMNEDSERVDMFVDNELS